MKALFLALVALPAIVGAGNPSASAILPDGTYVYEIEGAASVATSTIVVHREGAAIVMGESTSVNGIVITTQRRIDESTFATLSYALDGAGQHADVTVVGTQATVAQGEQSLKISASPDAPFVVSENLVAGWAQIPATLHATGDKQLTLACVCGGGFTAVRVSVTQSRPGRLELHGSDGIDVALRFDPQSFVLEQMEVPAQHSTVTLRSHESTVEALPKAVLGTPVPLPPARYQSRDVKIRADDGVTLAGTLSAPENTNGLVPGFVFVHGSGCIDRDETIGPNKVFLQLANALSNDGYAVLRYDKRSCGKSGGTFAQRNRLIADARDVIAYLRSQPGIDPKRIFVLGHSEGGELAPSIAIADGGLAGIVLLAPPALPLQQILLKQLLRNTPPADRAAGEQKQRAYINAVATGKRSDVYSAWLRSSFGIDPVALIRQVPCPILIVQGTKDIQVLAADTPRLVDAARSANRKLTVAMLDGDDHLFIKLAPGKVSTGGEYFTPAYLDPALFTTIENWLATLKT